MPNNSENKQQKVKGTRDITFLLKKYRSKEVQFTILQHNQIKTQNIHLENTF